MSRPITVGVVGVRRGGAFARGSEAATGLRLVALCDTWEERLEQERRDLAARGTAVTTYSDYDRFLEHDMDAVVLANHFHEHAPLAIAALRSGRHVMSECAACHTPAEGVALIRAVEETGRIYLFAENYPYMAYNQEMRRLYREGTVGTLPVRRGRVRASGQRAHQAGAKLRDGPLAQLDTGDPTTARTRWRRSCTSPTRAP